MNTYSSTTSALNLNYAAEIKSRLTMFDMVFCYLKASMKRENGGYISCPFHNEKTPSMYLWTDHFKCFGCGKSGDVISFTQMYFNIDFGQALSKLNVDFDLRLPIGEKPTLRQIHEANKFHTALTEKRNAEQAERNRIDAEYDHALSEYVRLDKQYRQYKPTAPCTELHPLFFEALSLRPFYHDKVKDCICQEFYFNRKDT